MTTSSSFSLGYSMRPLIRSSQAVTPSSGIRIRMAPSSSYALPSATSRSASSRQCSVRSSWNVTSPSQSARAAERTWIADRLDNLATGVGVLDRRQTRHLRAARRAFEECRVHPPMCRKPVGLSRSGRLEARGYRIACKSGLNVSSSAASTPPLDRIEAIGGIPSRSSHRAPPRGGRRTTSRDVRALQGTARGGRVEGVLCHARYL